jgi:uncharacterized protein (TIGR02646 family)
MRKVDRTPAPQSLTGPQSAGERELARARTHFGNRKTRATPFTFKAYAAEDVRESMRVMFRSKCAYCESRYEAVTIEDVEHYRPKGAYLDRGKQHKPGYWWLAMEWTNLLPSCPDCNRARTQKIVGKERKEIAGKANQFPLADGSVRGTDKTGVANEVPLLLDPTVDDPTEHLEFLPDGNIRAADRGQGESERGRVTIDVVALRRLGLIQERARAETATQVAITQVARDKKDIAREEARPPSADRTKELAELRERLAFDTAEMEKKAAPDAPYSALADAMIRRFKAEQGL